MISGHHHFRKHPNVYEVTETISKPSVSHRLRHPHHGFTCEGTQCIHSWFASGVYFSRKPTWNPQQIGSSFPIDIPSGNLAIANPHVQSEHPLLFTRGGWKHPLFRGCWYSMPQSITLREDGKCTLCRGETFGIPWISSSHHLQSRWNWYDWPCSISYRCLALNYDMITWLYAAYTWFYMWYIVQCINISRLCIHIGSQIYPFWKL